MPPENRNAAELGGPRSGLELWGGVECTLNRVGDVFFDQLGRSGHASRLEDLDALAGLGLQAIRYPILWERACRGADSPPEWDWSDRRLERLRSLGLRPIGGLVHHGSGPAGTHLLDPAWPERLAAFARAAAERYPWVRDWTPVNEPLTTARFSALYGHWYPHRRDGLSFARALLHQCRGVALAMDEIRRVIPDAGLVQTEDAGKTHATRALSYQAEFENERRWLTFDLLLGRVVRGHPLWEHLLWLGVPERDLAVFAERPCPPAVIGLNHYVTSERFLDERTERYPLETHGGNGRDAYADVEAVRVLAQGCDGPAALLREAWTRYRAPLAVTEAHLACAPEEQLRWFAEVWDAGLRAREEGADVRAVTAWSLLGSFDWSSLVTRDAGDYEPGAFDVRGGRPRPTALAGLLRSLAREGRCEHPVLDVAGWWRRPARLSYPPVVVASARPPALSSRAPGARRTPAVVLVLGCGPVADGVRLCCSARGLAVASWRGAAADATELARLARLRRAWALVHAAGAGDDAAAAARWGHELAAAARACRLTGARLLSFSSGAVFGPAASGPGAETDEPAPGDAAGCLLADAERRARELCPSAAIVRLGAEFGGTADPLRNALERLLSGAEVAVPAEPLLWWSHLPEAANAALDLLVDGGEGVRHLVSGAGATPADLLRRAAAAAGLERARIAARPRWAVSWVAAWLRAGRIAPHEPPLLPPLDASLQAWGAGRHPLRSADVLTLIR